jgi:hypothetical protein
MSPIYSFILADMWGGLEFSISRQIDSVLVSLKGILCEFQQL